mmetsp:Transcript_8784/g.37123  ORF Transcript_8784/g.37123 Transcript_8784/m.37123 type:complete len:299 (-) Transcript_8784:622-1518(-)
MKRTRRRRRRPRITVLLRRRLARHRDGGVDEPRVRPRVSGRDEAGEVERHLFVAVVVQTPGGVRDAAAARAQERLAGARVPLLRAFAQKQRAVGFSLEKRQEVEPRGAYLEPRVQVQARDRFIDADVTRRAVHGAHYSVFVESLDGGKRLGKRLGHRLRLDAHHAYSAPAPHDAARASALKKNVVVVRFVRVVRVKTLVARTEERLADDPHHRRAVHGDAHQTRHALARTCGELVRSVQRVHEHRHPRRVHGLEQVRRPIQTARERLFSLIGDRRVRARVPFFRRRGERRDGRRDVVW